MAFIERIKIIAELDLFYVDGGFVTRNEHPKDVDVIIEYPDMATWLRLVTVDHPYLNDRAQIKKDYKVDLLPCLPQLPLGVNDLREYFSISQTRGRS